MSGQTVMSNSFRRLWILGFAGHRSLPDPAAVEASIRAAIESFRKQVDGEVMGRASAASGADVLFLEACRDTGLAYSVVLPFAEERFREDFDSETEWARSKALIDGAASVEIAPGHEGAPEAYHLAAREILDVADAMLFVWDGKPARGIGGTEETIADSRERRVPHQIIRAEDGELSAFEITKPFPWKETEFTGCRAAMTCWWFSKPSTNGRCKVRRSRDCSLPDRSRSIRSPRSSPEFSLPSWAMRKRLQR
jgi:hypothetical protein